MAPQLPPLNSLRVFEAAARHSSFTAAASELHVTQGAVSQQIQLLESRLGVRLFERLPHGVVLTAVGRRYFYSLQPAFESLAQATRQILERGPEVLSLSVLPTFAMRWLLPRLPSFRSAYPDIELNLTVSLQTVDFSRTDVDMAIRHGRAPWPNLVDHLMFRQDLMPVCSPALLDGKHPLQHPIDLKHHTLLHVVREFDEWRDWLTAAGVRDIDPTHGLRFDSTKMALEAAIEGLGVAMGRHPFVGDNLRHGHLAAPFSMRLQSKSAYYLVYPIELAGQPKVQIFRDWLLDQVGTEHSAV